jgi:AcrR family transcriptional regulator
VPVREEEGGPRRRRRTPEAAQREIIEAAERLLRERPFRELTVDEVMRRTGLSRPSFYVYFKDRHDLVLRLVEQLGAELLELANRWLQGVGEGPQLVHAAFEGAIAVYGRHAAVLRALADAAVDDPDVEAAYGSLVQGFVEQTAGRLQQEMRAGSIAEIDAEETAKALIWMTERYLYHSFGAERGLPAGRVVQTLSAIWSRALYQAS